MLLRQMLYRCDIRLLPIIAGFWARNLESMNYEDLIRLICSRILDAEILRKFLNSTAGAELRAPLKYLCDNNGSVPTEDFQNRFGIQRVMGTEKIRREKAWQDPVSLTEKLWYRGLIFRGNSLSDDGYTELFQVPDDLLRILAGLLASEKELPLSEKKLVIRPAVPSETACVEPIHDDLIDIISLAAGLKRSGKPLEIPGYDFPISFKTFTDMLLSETGMFPEEADCDAERIRTFLIGNRTAGRIELVKNWLNAASYDELFSVPGGLQILEMPEHDPKLPRTAVFKWISSVPEDTWWSLNSFLNAVKKDDTMFLRRGFDGKHARFLDADGNDLSGISSWFQLEGAYISFLISGPFNWLGITQVACSGQDKQIPDAFRVSREGKFLLSEGTAAESSPEILSKPNLENEPPTVSGEGVISCGQNVSRYFRYTAARCCEIEKYKNKIFSFRITPDSLAAAERSDISRGAFLNLLRRFCGKKLPPSLERMLQEQSRTDLPASIYTATLLSVPRTEIMEELLEASRLERWILQRINDTTLLIDPRGVNEIRRFLMEKEIFVDVKL